MVFPSLISRVFDPMVVLTIFFPVLLSRSGIGGWDLAAHVFVFFVVMILPPAVLLSWAVRTRRITNWDISNRKQRVRALSVCFLFLLIDWAVVSLFGTPFVKQIFILFSLVFFGFFCITLRYKISGHMLVTTFILLLCIRWYGNGMMLCLGIIPLLAWSRLVLKRHTLFEVIGGVLYACVMFFLARELHLI